MIDHPPPLFVCRLGSARRSSPSGVCSSQKPCPAASSVSGGCCSPPSSCSSSSRPQPSGSPLSNQPSCVHCAGPLHIFTHTDLSIAASPSEMRSLATTGTRLTCSTTLGPAVLSRSSISSGQVRLVCFAVHELESVCPVALTPGLHSALYPARHRARLGDLCRLVGGPQKERPRGARARRRELNLARPLQAHLCHKEKLERHRYVSPVSSHRPTLGNRRSYPCSRCSPLQSSSHLPVCLSSRAGIQVTLPDTRSFSHINQHPLHLRDHRMELCHHLSPPKSASSSFPRNQPESPR